MVVSPAISRTKQRGCISVTSGSYVRFCPVFWVALFSDSVLIVETQGFIELVLLLNPIALRKAKIVCNFGLAECNRIKMNKYTFRGSKSSKENPQKLTQLSSRSHPRHLVGKRTAQKDTIIDITSDSQVNNNFPYRWSPASLTFNNYFYLFLYLYIA